MISHFDISQRTHWLRVLLSACMLAFLLGLPVARAAINESISALTIEGPFILDSDELDADPVTHRHALLTTAEITITRDFLDGLINTDYRVRYVLEDEAGNAIELAPGGVFQGFSDPFPVAMGILDTLFSQDVELLPDPLGTLDPALGYRVVASLQKDIGGGVWKPIAPSIPTGFQQILHFTNSLSGDAEYNYRGFLSELSWNQTYLVETDPANSAFLATVRLTVGRYDEFDEVLAVSAIATTIDFDLLDEALNSVPLEDEGIVVIPVNAPSYDSSSGRALAAVGSALLSNQVIKPLVQLDSTKTYTLRCTLRHEEDALATEYVDMKVDLAPNQLLHFNGNLLFGGLVATFNSIINMPSPLGGGLGYVDTAIALANEAGTLPDAEPYVFGDGALLNVQLEPDGDAVLATGSPPQAAHPPGQPAGTIQVDHHGTLVKYSGGVLLTPGGAAANSLTLCFPQGLGYIEDTSVDDMHGASDYIHLALVPLNNSLHLDGDFTVNLPPKAAVFDESHPLVLKTSSFTLPVGGAIEFLAPEGKYIHQDAFNTLDAFAAINFWDNAAMAIRYSNDLYWKAFVGTSGTGVVSFTTAADGSSRINGQFKLQDSKFRAHYPLKTQVHWQSDSVLTYVDGTPDSETSLLNDVAKVDVPYSINCADDPCGGDGEVIVTAFPDDQILNHTPSGGLWRAGVTAPTQLRWGARGNGGGGVTGYAHRTDAFTDTTFYMPGYQLYAANNVLFENMVFTASVGDNAPGSLLLAGFNEKPTSDAKLHYPTEGKYVIGDGSYRGLNFIVDSPGFGGASRLGGNNVDFTYGLLETNNASKYYIAMDGVSGRHVAKDGSWGDALEIYGYLFEFSSIQMRFLSSELKPPSWINGAVHVAGYSTFSQKFLGLTLSCIGELEDAEVDPSDLGAKSMNYWNSEFFPLSMRFAKKESGACPQQFEGFLEMGVKTSVAHVPGDLYGTFAFRPDGNLITPDDAVEGISSELGLPAAITIDGPNKNYEFINTSNLRYNNPAEAGHSTNDVLGFVTWAGTVNVPYFLDFKVQAITQANSSPAAAFYMASGWTEAGKTFFGNSDFDPKHKGWPIGAVSLEDYQLGNNPAYLIHAEQDMFGAVALDYPMKYDSVTRTFKSFEQVKEDIFVINIEHEVTYLDAKFTALEFGAKYDGLPQLSLTNLLNDQIDQAAELIGQELTAPVKSAMDQAFEEFDEMLSDSLAEAFQPVIEEAADQIIAPMYDDLSASYDQARSTGKTYAQWEATNLTAILEARIYKPGFPSELHEQLLKIKDAGEGAASFVDRLQKAVEGMILGIDTIANSVEIVDGDPVFHKDLLSIPGSAAGGLLSQESGEFQIISNIVGLLLENLTPPEVASILGPLLDAASSELNAELNVLLEDLEPALLVIIDTLNQVREFLVTIHTQIESAAGIVATFNDVMDLAVSSGELDVILASVSARSESLISNLANSHGIAPGDKLEDYLNLFDDINPDDFADAVASEITDQLLQSDIVEQIQFLVRQEINDIQLLFESTIQSILDQLTTVMKEVVSSTIGELESSVTEVLGDVSKFMGSGEISGFAEFNGDSLRKLRMDGIFQFSIPDEMELHVYLEVLAYNSEDNFVENACLKAGEKAVEVRIGAIDVDLDWISDGLRASMEVKMSLKDKGDGMRPNGVGGSFELTGGEISFSEFKITCFAVTMAIGFDEAYLGAKACGIFNSYEVSIGIFFGRTCTLDPLYFVDPDVAELIDPGTTFTGAYVYGEVWLPISEIILGIPASCLFRVSAGIGLGAGFFIEGPTFVAKMLAGVSGEALCVVSFQALIKMVGVIQANKLKAAGSGSVDVCLGPCPFCICFGATIKLTYDDGSWSVDY